MPYTTIILLHMPHVGKDPPIPRPAVLVGTIIVRSHLSGLHHKYRWIR